MAVILIGGGARSGKSRFALDKARAINGTRAFVATAEAADDEMSARIANHRLERGAEFSTIESPLEVARIIREATFDVLVIDCLTLWLSNLMGSGKNCAEEAGLLVQAAESVQSTVIFVTNEVGSGIVPTDHALSRDFRDHAGVLNQRVAAMASEVYVMFFGIAQRLK